MSPSDDKWDIKLPPLKELDGVSFGLIYFYPEVWNMMCDYVEEFGIDCGFFTIPPKEAIDAIKYGFIFPYYKLSSEDDHDIMFVFWNLLTHKYCYVEDMNMIELSTLMSTLNYGLWSYN